jgi:hypothetical protein
MQLILLALMLLGVPLAAQSSAVCTGCSDYVIGTSGWSMSYGPQMVWTVGGLENGLYAVELTFVEPSYTQPGQRPLNVWLNRTRMLSRFDVIAAGGPMTPVKRTGAAGVTDGTLRIELTASDTGFLKPVKHNAIVSTITIWRVPVDAPVLIVGGKKPAASPSRPATAVSGLAPVNCVAVDGYSDPALCNPAPDAFLPAPGVTYTDQTFGGQVRIFAGPDVYHTYSTPSPVSEGNKYLLTYTSMGRFDVRLFATGAMVRQGVAVNQGYAWDANDPETLYYNSGNAIRKYNVTTDVHADVKSFSGTYGDLRRGGTGDTSKDNWLPFWDASAQDVCVINLGSAATYCAHYADAPGLPAGYNVDYVLTSKGVDAVSGKRYVIVAGGPRNIVYAVNLATGVLDFDFLGPLLPSDTVRYWYSSHDDTLEVNGIQYVVQNNYLSPPGTWDFWSIRLNAGARSQEPAETGGGRTRVWVQTLANQFPTDDYASCAKKAPYCTFSTISRGRNAADPPEPERAHINEIFFWSGLDNSVKRMVKPHSVRWLDKGDLNYWSFPRPALSGDAKYIVFDSNFGTFNLFVNVLATGR